LVDIKAKIESWNKFKSELLRILSARERAKLNENRNGIFVTCRAFQMKPGKNYCRYQFVDEQVSQLELGENAMDQMKNALRKDDKVSP
jgi:protein-tyrosine phosphatase